MPRQSESKFYTSIKKDLDAIPNSWLVRIQQLGHSGTPDLIMCINGHFVALELKKSANAKGTRLQRYNIDKIQGAFGYAAIVHPDNWDLVFFQLKELSKKRIGVRTYD